MDFSSDGDRRRWRAAPMASGTDDSLWGMTQLIAALRAVAALGTLTAIVATFFDTASRSTINPFNFFGYFTMQSNLATLAVLLAAAVYGFRGRRQPPGLVLARGCVTTYIVIVGIVYNLLLSGLEGGVTLAWANTVLHVLLPIYAALDWILFADRGPLPWRRFWIVLVYPVVWLIVVLVRGATDGWVPYPFLDPAQGYGVVALFAVGIAVAFAAVGAGVWAVSRMAVVRA
jgi:hypothetical protein